MLASGFEPTTLRPCLAAPSLQALTPSSSASQVLFGKPSLTNLFSKTFELKELSSRGDNLLVATLVALSRTLQMVSTVFLVLGSSIGWRLGARFL